MTYDSPGVGALDYFPCRHGSSRLLFRGPWRPPAPDAVVALGGTATYGRFVLRPWPQLLEAASGRMVVNMAVPHAGPDLWLNDPGALALARVAPLRILQVPGAINLSNPLYTVHPRRNDRFLAASARLRHLYPEVDFTDFAFTRHMIHSLAARGAARFQEVQSILTTCWRERMGVLLTELSGPTILLWCGDHPPPREATTALAGAGPMLVDQAMLRGLVPQMADWVEVVVPDFAGGMTGKAFGPLEIAAARQVPGPATHAAIAAALVPWLMPLAV